MDKTLGLITGLIIGTLTGWLIGNYIIFPILLGDTITGVLLGL